MLFAVLITFELVSNTLTNLMLFNCRIMSQSSGSAATATVTAKHPTYSKMIQQSITALGVS